MSSEKKSIVPKWTELNELAGLTVSCYLVLCVIPFLITSDAFKILEISI